jgi:hypothetical protein
MFRKNIIKTQPKVQFFCSRHMLQFLQILVNKTMELLSNANITLQTTYSHILNKQLDEANERRSGNALSTKDDP